MKMSNATLCRRCLMVYTSLVLAITSAYLVAKWGVHTSYITMREDLMSHQNGEGDLEGLAFTESGGAEYLLVLLYFILHAVTLVLLLCGRQRNIVMGVACALLLTSSMLYILFYGCLWLQARMETYNALPLSGESPSQKQAQAGPYKLTAQDVDRTIASGSAGAEAVVAKAPPGQEFDQGTCGGNGGGVLHTGDALSYSDLGWTVLETLVDVMSAIVNGPEEEGEKGSGDPAAQRYHPDGVPLAPTSAFFSIRRPSLLAMSVVGFVLSLWGVNTFDMSPDGVARAANPGLTASALSQLSATAPASSSTAAAATTAAAREERRRARAAAALQEATSAPAAGTTATAAAKEAKKNQ